MSMDLTPEQVARIEAASKAAKDRLAEQFTNSMIGLFEFFGQPDTTVYPTREEYEQEIEEAIKKRNAKKDKGGE